MFRNIAFSFSLWRGANNDSSIVSQAGMAEVSAILRYCVDDSRRRHPARERVRKTSYARDGTRRAFTIVAAPRVRVRRWRGGRYIHGRIRAETDGLRCGEPDIKQRETFAR